MRAAIYARVSTESQHTDNQVFELREWARALAYDVVAEYVDVQSGAGDDRPGLQQLLADARRRRFELVLFWSLDRLSRGGIARTLSLLRQLADRGVKFRSLRQDCIDSAGPFGELLIAVFAALGDIERRQHAERTRAGIQRARLRGTQFGRPRRIVDVIAIQNLLSQGHSLAQTAQRLGVSQSTIIRRLQSASKKNKDAAISRLASQSEPADGSGSGSEAAAVHDVDDGAPGPPAAPASSKTSDA